MRWMNQSQLKALPGSSSLSSAVRGVSPHSTRKHQKPILTGTATSGR